MSEGDHARASERFREVLAADPRNESALFELGKTRYITRDHDEAVEIFDRLIRLNPRNVHAFLLLGKAYKEMGMPQRALRVFEDVDSDSAGAELYRELSGIYEGERDYPLATRMLEKLLELEPENTDAAVRLVQLYNFQGRRSAAAALAARWQARKGLDNFYRNLFLNEREIAEGRQVLASHPRIMLVTLTSRCNLRCPMCGRSLNPWDISDTLRDQIRARLPYLELITWQGGEVFLYPHFRMLLDEARKNQRLKQIIITNGLLMTREWADTLARDGNIDLTVSIDGVTKDTYEKLRLGGAFEKLTANLAMIDEARTRHSSRMTLTLRCALMQSNYREAEAFVEFARRFRFDVVMMRPLSSPNPDDPENIFARKDAAALGHIAAVRDRLRRTAEENGIRLLDWLPAIPDDIPAVEDPSATPFDELPVPPAVRGTAPQYDAGPGAMQEADPASPAGSCVLQEQADAATAEQPQEELSRCEACDGAAALPADDAAAVPPLCFRPWKQIAVNVNGTIYPECLCGEPLGTLFDTTFDAVWNGEKMQAYRREIAGRTYAWCGAACTTGEIPPEHLKFTCG